MFCQVEKIFNFKIISRPKQKGTTLQRCALSTLMALVPINAISLFVKRFLLMAEYHQ
jgi:hypothetical protein